MNERETLALEALKKIVATIPHMEGNSISTHSLLKVCWDTIAALQAPSPSGNEEPQSGADVREIDDDVVAFVDKLTESHDINPMIVGLWYAKVQAFLNSRLAESRPTSVNQTSVNTVVSKQERRRLFEEKGKYSDLDFEHCNYPGEDEYAFSSTERAYQIWCDAWDTALQLPAALGGSKEQPSQVSSEVVAYPIPTADEKQGGWTIATSFIEQLQKEARDHFQSGDVAWEDIEAILLALAKLKGGA